MIIPYISPSFVANAGVSIEQLPLIHLFGDAATFFSMRWFGRMADRHGHLKVFTRASLAALPPMLVITLLTPLPIALILAVSTAFMVLSSGRMVPGMAMVTGSVAPRLRGGFMNVNSAFQQVASGLAAMIAGAIIVSCEDGRMLRYPWVGALGCACVLLSLLIPGRLRLPAGGGPAAAPSAAAPAGSGAAAAGSGVRETQGPGGPPD